ncbi:acyl carrier protein [Micromonospora carbonacea]|uniref:acyl carrier protein n=1 Tax=Micromonospora carbonacea TaxID=47853 RepID=UPI003D950FB3
MTTATENNILDVIRNEAAKLVPGLDAGHLRPEVYIADVGIESVQMIELVARLEEHFDVTLPDYELSGVETIGGLIDLVAAGTRDR